MRCAFDLGADALVCDCCGGSRSLRADNIDLSTVPSRDTVQLTIYNSEDITLVRETRKVTFKKGVNPLQFSWANTLIDPTSVELKFLTHADKLDVLDTTFPHAKPQMLYWNVQSEMDGEATIQITYFTSGITWTRGLHLHRRRRAKTQMSFEGFVRVHNNSGEEYEDAQVRLVVGTINLVEKIAQLAQVPLAEVLRDGSREAAGAARRTPPTASCSGPAASAAARAARRPRKRRSSRKASASTSSIRSKAPRRSPTAGRSGCGRSKARRCRSRFNTAIGRPSMASSSCGCTC